MTGPHPLDAAAVAHDVYLRWHLGTDPAARSWRVEDAVAVVVPRGAELGCLAVGDPAQIPLVVAEALTTLGAEGVAEVRLSLPPEVETPAAERIPDLNRWEWMWTDRSPGAPDGVEWLDVGDHADLADHADHADLADLAALLAHSPRAHARPGDPGVRGWAGVRRSGRLLGAGALCSAPSGTPHLRAIVTHPDHRGTGLGAAVTAFLTREGLRDSPVVTLGMYSDNDGARRLYHRLGYTTSHRWLSSPARLVDPAADLSGRTPVAI